MIIFYLKTHHQLLSIAGLFQSFPCRADVCNSFCPGDVSPPCVPGRGHRDGGSLGPEGSALRSLPPVPGHGVGARCCAGQCTWRASSLATWLNTLLPSSFSSYRAFLQSCYLLVLMCTLWENDNSTGMFPCTRGSSHSCSCSLHEL